MLLKIAIIAITLLCPLTATASNGETSSLLSSKPNAAPKKRQTRNYKKALQHLFTADVFASEGALNIWTEEQIAKHFGLEDFDAFLKIFSVICTSYMEYWTKGLSFGQTIVVGPDYDLEANVSTDTTTYGAINDSTITSPPPSESIDASTPKIGRGHCSLNKFVFYVFSILANTSPWNATLAAKKVLEGENPNPNLYAVYFLAALFYIPDLVTSGTFDAENCHEAFHELVALAKGETMRNPGERAKAFLICATALIAATAAACLYFYSNNEGYIQAANDWGWNPGNSTYVTVPITILHFLMDAPTKANKMLKAYEKRIKRGQFPTRNEKYYPIHCAIAYGMYLPFVFAANITAVEYICKKLSRLDKDNARIAAVLLSATTALAKYAVNIGFIEEHVYQ